MTTIPHSLISSLTLLLQVVSFDEARIYCARILLQTVANTQCNINNNFIITILVHYRRLRRLVFKTCRIPLRVFDIFSEEFFGDFFLLQLNFINCQWKNVISYFQLPCPRQIHFDFLVPPLLWSNQPFPLPVNTTRNSNLKSSYLNKQFNVTVCSLVKSSVTSTGLSPSTFWSIQELFSAKIYIVYITFTSWDALSPTLKLAPDDLPLLSLEISW